VCAPAPLGFVHRQFPNAPEPLPFTRMKLPQAGHMQFCKTGRGTPFWNAMCGCGHTTNEAVLHQASSLMVGYLLEYGYSRLSQVPNSNSLIIVHFVKPLNQDASK
jgi:hypothetical protein